MNVADGIFWINRFSIGYNFHATRKIKTFGLAVSVQPDAWLFVLGPLTVCWLKWI